MDHAHQPLSYEMSSGKSRLQNKGGGGVVIQALEKSQLERFEMAVRMSILKQVTESDWVMHINYCITSNQRVTPLKSVNLNIQACLQACSRLQESKESGSGKVAWKPHGG